jgi:hypothetical protein
MNAKTLLRAILFLPYLAWLIMLPLTNLPTTSMFQLVVVGVSVAYLVGIFYWGVPYTILVVGLLLWSRNKSEKEFDVFLSCSPILLALLTIAELTVLYLYFVLTSQVYLMDFYDFTWSLFLAVLGSFIYGYAFLFVGKTIYRILESLGFIKDDKEPTVDITDANI